MIFRLLKVQISVASLSGEEPKTPLRFFHLLSLLSGLLLFTACNTGNPTHSLSRQDEEHLKLWYTQPAEKWTDALPIGNGRIGGMIFGRPEQERVQFNEETLWTSEPRDYHREGAAQHLEQIRQLLFEGKQEEAEKLAADKFMGRMSNEENYDVQLAEWMQGVTTLAGKSPVQPDFDDSDWEETDIPFNRGWEDEGDLEGVDGAVWFRKSFELPADWKGEDLMLELGKIRDDDFTYVNGTRVGSTEGRNNYREYKVPAPLLQEGTNYITVQIINYQDKGGFIGFKNKDPLAIYPLEEGREKGIVLSGAWKYRIQDDEPPHVPRFQAAYQPFGDLWLDFKGHEEVTDYRRELDLANALSRVSYQLDGVQYSREFFVSEPDQVMVVKLKASEPGKLSFEARLDSPHKLSATRKVDEQTLGLKVEVRNGVLEGESQLRVQTSGGRHSLSDDKLVVEEADEVTLFLTAGTNYVNYQDVSGDPAALCRQALQNIEGKDYEQIRTDHIEEYRQYFDQLSITMGEQNTSEPTDERLAAFASSPEPDLVALYLQYGRYLLISSSRPGTRPANLQGIWNDQLTPPWDSKYTSNINFEMNYWPAELLNLSECHEPLFDMVEEMAENGQKTAKAHYDASGWVSHHNTDLWRGTAPINASNHGIWVTGGAWLSHHFWEHYLFTQDTAFLEERAYPIMKGAARFFTDFLIEEPEHGWLISTPSNSPETGGLVAGPTMDHQIIRSLFKACIEAGEILDNNDPFLDTLRQMVPEIAPNQIGRLGQLQEWLEDVDDPDNDHRHVSHLWAVHPGNEINWEESPELMEAARQSLIFRGDEGTGWSLAWKINFWARFKDGDHAFKMVKMLLTPAEGPDGKERGGSYTNLFDAHPPFQIDGNFGGAAGIAEMLVQSHTGTVELLPALPGALPSGEIKGVRARGGFELNMRWDEGELQNIEVISHAGAPCTLRYGDKETSFETEEGQTYHFDENLNLL